MTIRKNEKYYEWEIKDNRPDSFNNCLNLPAHLTKDLIAILCEK